MRIHTKRLRYALEMTDEMTGRRGRKAVKRLTEMQDLLGSHHDAVIAIAWLRRFADTANAPPAALLAAGALIQSLHRLQIKLTSRSLEHWEKARAGRHYPESARGSRTPRTTARPGAGGARGMILYVLRHAQAEDKAEQGGDEARRLTARGRDKMRSAAAGFRAMSLKFDAIVTSPYSRAAETAEIVAAVYANDPPPQVLPALASGIPPVEAVAALAPFARYEHLMIVGHEPQLSGVVSLCSADQARSSICVSRRANASRLSCPNRFERGGAELLWMLSQSQLRKFRK